MASLTWRASLPLTARWHWVVGALAVGLLIAATVRIVVGFATVPMAVGLDYGIYQDRAHDFLAGRGLYLPRQLAGPYDVEIGDSLYPPSMLVLFVAFTVLPSVLWWLIPLAVATVIVVRHRPSPCAWLAIGALALTDGTLLSVVKGNPALWIMAAIAVGTVWRPAFALVFLKPSVAPFAFLGARDRQWWLAVALLGMASLAFLPLWADYARVVVFARDPRGLLYSAQEVPMLLIPVVAWAGRGSGGRAPQLDLADHEVQRAA